MWGPSLRRTDDNEVVVNGRPWETNADPFGMTSKRTSAAKGMGSLDGDLRRPASIRS
jgi:hypothetical protein